MGRVKKLEEGALGRVQSRPGPRGGQARAGPPTTRSRWFLRQNPAFSRAVEPLPRPTTPCALGQRCRRSPLQTQAPGREEIHTKRQDPGVQRCEHTPHTAPDPSGEPSHRHALLTLSLPTARVHGLVPELAGRRPRARQPGKPAQTGTSTAPVGCHGVPSTVPQLPEPSAPMVSVLRCADRDLGQAAALLSNDKVWPRRLGHHDASRRRCQLAVWLRAALSGLGVLQAQGDSVTHRTTGSETACHQGRLGLTHGSPDATPPRPPVRLRPRSLDRHPNLRPPSGSPRTQNRAESPRAMTQCRLRSQATP